MMVYAIPLLLSVLLFALAYYVGRRLINPSWSEGVRLTLWTMLIVMAACVPLLFVFRRFAFLHQDSIILQGMQYALGLYTIVLFMTIARDVFLILIAAIQAIQSVFKKSSQIFQPYATYQQQLHRRAFLLQETRIGALVGTVGVLGVQQSGQIVRNPRWSAVRLRLPIYPQHWTVYGLCKFRICMLVKYTTLYH